MLSVTRNLNIYKIGNTKTENKWDNFERQGSYRKQERRHSVQVDVRSLVTMWCYRHCYSTLCAPLQDKVKGGFSAFIFTHKIS